MVTTILANDGKEKWPMLLDRKDRPHQRTHLSQRKKRSGLLLIYFCFCFCSYTFSFLWFKGIKLKEKLKTKKTGVRIRPSLAGYGLRTRIWATLAQILIPGPVKDPLLRIRGPGACLRARTYGTLRTVFGLTDSFWT